MTEKQKKTLDYLAEAVSAQLKKTKKTKYSIYTNDGICKNTVYTFLLKKNMISLTTLIDILDAVGLKLVVVEKEQDNKEQN